MPGFRLPVGSSGLLLQQPPVGSLFFVLDGRLQRAAFQQPRAERGLDGWLQRAASSATSGWLLAFRSRRLAPAGCFFSNLRLAFGFSFSTGGSGGLLSSNFPFAASGPWSFSGFLWEQEGHRQVDRLMTPLDDFGIFVHEALCLPVGLFLTQEEMSER